jgi:hypothetical protein
MNLLNNLIKGLAPAQYKMVTHAYSFFVGLVIAILFSYVLYRLGLPSKPFIYVSF